MALLDRISSPADLKALSAEECGELADEIRSFIVDAVTHNGGHLGSNLGAVELTIALHRVFTSPEDVILFDTGHQAYVHKILTGRKEGFAALRKTGGLSGYPNRDESPHDVIENSHASTALSWAHGIAAARERLGAEGHHVVAVVGDGALTGGMAYEALNNLGHSSSRVVIVLNDNGRSYAPTISRLSGSLTQLRLDPRFLRFRGLLKELIDEVPVMGQIADRSYRGLTSALREVVEPHVFFEALGVRYTGPIDGHDVAGMEQALSRASSWEGPIVLHVLTTKGKGYAPAEDDEVACLHDLKVPPPVLHPLPHQESYTEAFTAALIGEAAEDNRIVGITAAMPGPTGLLSFEKAFPDRFFDVGIAEQHAMTMAAGMAKGGLRPVLCVYSTFLQRCVDQWNLDVGLHDAPVVVVSDRAGVTGDDGPSHHGLYDLRSALSIPPVAVFAPSQPSDVTWSLHEALSYDGPSLIRYPKTAFCGWIHSSGYFGPHRIVREGDGDVVLVGIGKLALAAQEAAELLDKEGLSLTVVDPRVIRPTAPELVRLLADAQLVVTAEDGLYHGGAGAYLADLAARSAELDGVAGPRFVHLGVPVEFLPHGRPDEILASLGLDAAGIAGSVRAAAQRYRRSPEEDVVMRPRELRPAAGGGAGARRRR